MEIKTTTARARKSLRAGEVSSRAVAAESGTATRVRKTIPAGDSTPSRGRAVAAEASTASRPRKTLSSDAHVSPAATPRKTIGRGPDPIRPALHAAEDRETSGGRHRRSAERLDTATGRHRLTPENPPARHRAEQHPAHDPDDSWPAITADPEQQASGGASGPLWPAPPADSSAGSPARHAQPRPTRPPVDPATGLPPGMTRGILELAAERLAASRAAQPADGDGEEPEAEEPELDEVDETPRPAARRGGRSAGGPGLRTAATPAAGTRPGSGPRPPLASRPPAGPPEAVRPPTTPIDPAMRHAPTTPIDPAMRHAPTTPIDPAMRHAPTIPADSGPLRSPAGPAAESPQLGWPASTRRPRGSRRETDAPSTDGPQLVRPIRADRPAPPELEQTVEEPPGHEPIEDDGRPLRPSRRRPIVRPAPAANLPGVDRPVVARPDFYRAAAHPVPAAEAPAETIAYAVPGTAIAPAHMESEPVAGALTTYAGNGRPMPANAPDTVESDHETEDETWFWSTAEHPAGLPESVRLPVGIPEGLWHPAEHEPVHDDQPTHEQPAFAEAPAIAMPETVPSEAAPSGVVPSGAALSGVVPSEAAPSGVALSEAAPSGVALSEVEIRESLVPYQPLPIAGAAETPVVEIDRTGPPPDVDGPAEVTPSGRKVLRRRRRVTLLAYIIVICLVLVVGHELRDRRRPGLADRAAEPIGATAPQVTQTKEEPDKVGSVQGETPAAGETSGQAGDFRYVESRGSTLGKSGRLHRFRVAVEETVPEVEPDVFARAIDSTLGDKRSWIRSGKVRLRRVPESAEADFTIYLASAATSEKMCAAGGLHTEGFTSCRVPGQVIINAERWADAVPDYDGELWEYRQYTINHEVGHELGHGHESCPGKGKPAPVMLQQTYGLDGCTRNAWPYLDGKRYEGEPVP
ncbi:DUF3152 domain-containing protein [Actinoplanes sp. NPDC020271]|uniref:DUF3152 domain-containing protein n=1 Tax=Actinoplanes sp. NPDC020271 TaxID=3363896 RepID=UPI00379D60BA